MLDANKLQDKHLFVAWAHPDIIEAIELRVQERNT
jgi:hypothetical protein